MHLQLTTRNIIAFLLFAVLMGEAHEMAHFFVGKLVCSCWPAERDFNAWRLCESCETGPYGFWATAAGPVFSMTLAWIGMFLLRSWDDRRKSLGFVLIWANVPQARIMTVLMGGGDEMVVMRMLTKGTALAPHYKWLTVAIVLLMALPPIIAAFRAVENKGGWLINIGFMVLPLLVLGSYGFVFLNGLLQRGFLAEPWIMGTPLFITLHTALVLVVLLAAFRRHLFKMVA
ncbi:MAG: hypothetical protein AB7K37_01950 [Cyclobacteriaceae bacterium]